MTTLKESLLYAFWRVCGLVCFHRDMINARYQQTEPAVLIATTALVTYVGQRALRRLIYGEGEFCAVSLAKLSECTYPRGQTESRAPRCSLGVDFGY
ncbi:hypothetical protein MRX96_023038 [Rhipicephalus microplus]